jgi:hypothetical protein
MYIPGRLSHGDNVQDEAAFGRTLESQAAIRNREEDSCRGLLEGFSKLVSDLMEASRNFILDFLHMKTIKYCEYHQRSYKKYCFDF